MPLPTKSRYTIAEAAKFIATAAGEAVTQSQVLDWGTQGLYKLHLAIEHCNIRAIGATEIVLVRNSIIEIHLNGSHAATLARGDRVGVSDCWHNGIACNFVRRSTYGPVWRPDDVYFRIAGLVVLGTELEAFAASIAPTQQTAPAADTAKPGPVVTETKEQRQDRRLLACEAAGLVMPKNHLSRLPDGVGNMAAGEGVERQPFSKDVKAALKRRESAGRNGVVHKT